MGCSTTAGPGCDDGHCTNCSTNCSIDRCMGGGTDRAPSPTQCSLSPYATPVTREPARTGIFATGSIKKRLYQQQQQLHRRKTLTPRSAANRTVQGSGMYRLVIVQLLLCTAAVPYLASLVSRTEQSLPAEHPKMTSWNRSTEKPDSRLQAHPRATGDAGRDGVLPPPASASIVGDATSILSRADIEAIRPDIPFMDLDLPLIHIVNSRFMQDQADLVHLAEARLDLFETFCFPGMKGQTIEPEGLDPGRPPTREQLERYRFLWILKVDPDLDPAIRDRMVRLMRPYPNFFLVGSNLNFGVGVRPGSWRGGEAGAHILEERDDVSVFAGSLELLKYAHLMREHKIVVETRLDADDGLPFHFLEAMANTAVHKLSPASEQHRDTEDVPQRSADWLYWCASESINWYPTAMYKGLEKANADEIELEQDPGRFTIDAKGNNGAPICLTPGLSTGLAVGVSFEDMPQFGHFTLMHEIKYYDGSCGLEDMMQCLRVVETRPIRSRTPTSAGMKNLKLEGKPVSNTLVDKQWTYVENVFGVERDAVYKTNLHMQRNIVPILQDNYRGQCTTGHSCKRETKDTLKKMIEQVGGQKALEALPSKPLVFLRKKQQQDELDQAALQVQ